MSCIAHGDMSGMAYMAGTILTKELLLHMLMHMEPPHCEYHQIQRQQEAGYAGSMLVSIHCLSVI